MAKISEAELLHRIWEGDFLIAGPDCNGMIFTCQCCEAMARFCDDLQHKPDCLVLELEAWARGQ